MKIPIAAALFSLIPAHPDIPDDNPDNSSYDEPDCAKQEHPYFKNPFDNSPGHASYDIDGSDNQIKDNRYSQPAEHSTRPPFESVKEFFDDCVWHQITFKLICRKG
ncbi:MAG TPA: hypothetical protein VF766_14935, partial [Pyrinomonadaceae bacterium]